MERDFGADGDTIEAADPGGNPFTDGSGRWPLARGMEMGHIFQARQIAEALGLKVLNENGPSWSRSRWARTVSGSPAPSRRWPRRPATKDCEAPERAPFDVHILAAANGEVILEAATDLARELDDAGVNVLLDDRKAAPA